MNKSSTIGTDRTIVLDENPRRLFATFTNNSVEDITLLLGDSGAVGAGIVLKSGGGMYEINLTNPWNAPVYAICTSGSMELSNIEVTGSARE